MVADPEKIRVMLVDDHGMVRRGLAAFLSIQPDLSLVGEAANGQEAIEECQRIQPDVILMDLVMPEMDGATAIQIIKERWPNIQIIALTSFPEKDLVHRALQAGAISYLLKNVSAHELAKAIRSARIGRPTLAPEATKALIRTARQEPPPGHDLTPRERQVLALMVEGLSNPEIAKDLSVSRSTARAHVSQILSKLGVTNRAEAIALAFRSGLVS
jgi:NarL family two-component system response regulator LiaR